MYNNENCIESKVQYTFDIRLARYVIMQAL